MTDDPKPLTPEECGECTGVSRVAPCLDCLPRVWQEQRATIEARNQEVRELRASRDELRNWLYTIHKAPRLFGSEIASWALGDNDYAWVSDEHPEWPLSWEDAKDAE